jgi:Cu+-exporting ATPase
MSDIHDRQVLTVAGTAPAPGLLRAGARTVVVDGVAVALTGELRAGRASELHFSFSDARTGSPVTDLQPYLAAAGHIVVMRSDAQTFAHEHAEVADGRGRPRFATPGVTFGPELDVHVHADTPATYRLWAQFELAGGRVITAPFTLHAT